MRSVLKRIGNAVFLMLLCPAGVLAHFGRAVLGSEEVFLLHAHLFAIVPGQLGVFTRRAYYWWTLKACGNDLVVGFGSFFTGSQVILGDSVWIGQYSVLGNVVIGSRVLISDHVSVLTGRYQHVRDRAGMLIVAHDRLIRVTIGRDTWIGAGAIIMADVGEQCIVGAGAVVIEPVPARSTAVGVPARSTGESRRPE